MSTVWYTADIHLGHRFVADLRGYDNPDDHDAELMSNLRNDTRPGDVIWILGDISSGGATGQRNALAHLAELRDAGRTLHLIAGNHDGVHPMHRRALRWDGEYREVFTSVQSFARRRINGAEVWLSHFPWRGGGDHTERDRYETVRLNDDGTSWLLHGHTHSPERADWPRRMIQVGVDAWGGHPVSMNALANFMGLTPQAS